VLLGVVGLSLFPATATWAQQESTQLISTQKLGTEIIETLIYSIIGEVTHKENRALAILAGSMMLGVCIIIASVLVS